MKTDYSPSALERRLREVADRTDLRADRRTHAKIDYAVEALERRLRTVSALRRACLELADARPVPKPEPAKIE